MFYINLIILLCTSLWLLPATCSLRSYPMHSGPPLSLCTEHLTLVTQGRGHMVISFSGQRDVKPWQQGTCLGSMKQVGRTRVIACLGYPRSWSLLQPTLLPRGTPEYCPCIGWRRFTMKTREGCPQRTSITLEKEWILR